MIYTLVAKVKEKKMANKQKWLRILVMVLVFGIMVGGCWLDDENGTIPPELIGRWSTNENYPANGTVFIISIDKFVYLSTAFDYSVSGNTVIVRWSDDERGRFNYSINDREMTISSCIGMFKDMNGYLFFQY